MKKLTLILAATFLLFSCSESSDDNKEEQETPKPVEICDNGKDDDGDGFIDSADFDCNKVADAKTEICDNGIDDDGDGFTDDEDNDCKKVVTITDIDWEVSQITSDGKIENPDNSSYTLKFKTDGNVSVILNVNTCQGTYSKNESSITFGVLACTKLVGDSDFAVLLKQKIALMDTIVADSNTITLSSSTTNNKIILKQKEAIK